MNSDIYDIVLPRVAVLLASYNGRLWMEEQVSSILSQKGVDVTLVVSVDASNDGSEEWFEQLACHDERVRLLPHNSYVSGAGANFFRLISEVDSEEFDFIALADQDDIWLHDKLRHAVEVIKKMGIDAYSGNVLAVWEDGREQLVEKSKPQRQWDFLFEAAGPGCTYVFSAAFYGALRQFVQLHSAELKGIHLHDWFCYAFARSRGFTWFIDPEPKMFYRQHSLNQVGVNTGFKAVFIRLKNISNGWWLGQARNLAGVLGLQNEAFVRPWIKPGKRSGYVHLLINVFRCRRKASDAAFMGAIMVVMWVLNP